MDIEEVKAAISLGIGRIAEADDLARLFEVQPNVLKSAFLHSEKITLTRHILNTRIARAKELLSQSDLECRTICYLVGFSRLDVGLRAFKRETGLSMGQYREEARALSGTDS